MEIKVNCEVDCIQGCILGENCPNRQYQKKAANFIKDTSLEDMIEIAEIAKLKRLTAKPQWVIPDEI